MSATSRRMVRKLLGLATMFVVVLVGRAAPVLAQNSSDLSVTLTNTAASPNGADFAAGSWVVTSMAYTAVCGNNRPRCVVRIQSTAALSKPAGSLTQLEYSVDGSAFAPVPSGATPLGASFIGTKTGTIVIRYLLGWAGNPFTPASATAYTQPISLTLQQGQP